MLSYDAMGHLVETATTGIATTQYLYAGDRLIGEFDAGDNLQRRYVHGVNVDEPLVWYEGADTSDRRWLFADERGSVVAMADAAGAVLAVNTYDAYGKPGAQNIGRFQYTGQTFITEVGLFHYKARFYSPDLGRFLQTDPIGYEDQTNLYAYVANDPINATDPTGTISVLGYARSSAIGARNLFRKAAGERTVYVSVDVSLILSSIGVDKTYGLAFDGTTGEVFTYENGASGDGNYGTSNVDGAESTASINLGYADERDVLTSASKTESIDLGIAGVSETRDLESDKVVGREISFGPGVGGARTYTHGEEISEIASMEDLTSDEGCTERQ